MHFNTILQFVIENRDVLITFLISLIAVVKLSTWGKAQSAALDAVVGVIERIGAGEVKSRVAQSQVSLSSAAKDALTDSVAKADPKKERPSLAIRVLREIFRR